jgi:predicted GNAT family N-acyltransferase
MSNTIFKSVSTAAELRNAFSVRQLVFVEEQQIAKEEEYDGLDDTAVHFIALKGEQVIGTARLRFPSPEYGKIERMAVLKQFRRRGIGKGLLDCIEKELKKRQITRIVLHAQTVAVPFFRACGIIENGPVFLEAGIEHVNMSKNI